jgi:NTP pyrophosphatase (non-canonical NTP hydrolase)
MHDYETREKFVEELGDVLMYFIDVLNRYKITPEEFSSIYMKKFSTNMVRDFKKEHEDI